MVTLAHPDIPGGPTPVVLRACVELVSRDLSDYWSSAYRRTCSLWSVRSKHRVSAVQSVVDDVEIIVLSESQFMDKGGFSKGKL